MDAPDRRVILVFARAPVLGTVKTRLAVHLGDRVVLRLYRCFILDLLETLDGLEPPVIICHTPADAGPMFRQWLSGRYTLMPQNGGHLGLRMAAAFQEVFASGFKQAVLVGSDVPDLPGTHISQAFSDLQNADAVIGPSADGGYYLVGFRDDTFRPALFDTAAWGTPQVLEETLAIARAEGLKINLQPRWKDIDDAAGLADFIHRNTSDRSTAPRTLAYLQDAELLYDYK
ncbi:hypothetical protein D3OALGB2SA_4664 [Olavius algarvensis associated proteobacterium Delta 3]|nr:hypothetical protein D3OALGB2SA_4664 [Olavius algarvensis associated proteobacterium Delta 3]